ncbi:MAG: sigma factor [Candidatus Coatesbacteria bacterium]
MEDKMGPEPIDAYLSSVREIPELAPDDARSLGWLSWSGDWAARQELIERHLWLVVEMAERLRPGGSAQADLIVDGNVALVRAAEVYRPWQDGEFGAYAEEYLLREIGKEVLPAA